MIRENGERRSYMDDDAVRRAKAELYRQKLFQYYLQLRNAPEEIVEAREEELHDNLRSMGFDPIEGTTQSADEEEKVLEESSLPKKAYLLC